MSTKTFQVGDRVKWTSQANGGWRKKVGTVIEVVPAGRYSNLGSGCSPRKAESYVIEVPGKTPNAKPQIYFPVPSLVKKAGRDKLGKF
jgi:hypothetical protein